MCFWGCVSGAAGKESALPTGKGKLEATMRVMPLEPDNGQESVFGVAGQLFDCCP